MSNGYTVRECFYSLQGEGARAGTANVFLRFAGCNLACSVALEGFNCDTDFSFGGKLALDAVIRLVRRIDMGDCKKIILTGGEPMLQVDEALLVALHGAGYYVAVETNGTKRVPSSVDVGAKGVDYIACSPKPGSEVALVRADEVRCVVQTGQEPDHRGVVASAYFVSPAFVAPGDVPAARASRKWVGSADDADSLAIDWAVSVCKRQVGWGEIRWRLSVQQHKFWGVE